MRSSCEADSEQRSAVDRESRSEGEGAIEREQTRGRRRESNQSREADARPQRIAREIRALFFKRGKPGFLICS